MSTAVPGDTIWLVVTAVAVGTFAFRLSFYLLFGRMETVPSRLQQVLGLVGPAVIAALVLPSVLVQGGTVAVATPEVVAALVAAVVGRRTGNIAATVGVGMLVLWTLTWLA